MAKRFLQSSGVAVLLVVVALLFRLGVSPDVGQAQSQTPAAAEKAGPAPKTPWGAPDLQGIWTNTHEIPLQRPARYADKEFFTDEELAELDKQRTAILSQDVRRHERGSEQDVGGAYSTNIFLSHKPTGRRTSLIIDPPDGRIPPLTPEATKRRQVMRDFQLALLQATEVCKNKLPGCEGGKYGPPVAEARRDAAVLSGDRRRGRRRDQSLGRPGGSHARRAVHGRHPARFRRRRRFLPADHPVARLGLHLLRHRPGPGLAAGDSDHRPPASAVERPAVVGRFARPLGRRHAGRRRDELLGQDRLSGLAREPASRRAVHAPRRQHDRVRRDDRGSDDVDAILDRDPGVDEAVRRGQSASTKSRGVTRATTGCRRCSPARAPRSAPSRRAAARIRPRCAARAAAASPAGSPTPAKKSIRC